MSLQGPSHCRLAEGGDSIFYLGIREKGLIGPPWCVFAFSWDPAQSHSESIWWRDWILLGISMGKTEGRNVFKILLRHLLILFFRVLLSCQLSCLCLSFSSFPHSWAKLMPNHYYSLKFPLEWWWWRERWEDGLINHTAPQTQCLAPRRTQWVTDEWMSEWMNEWVNKWVS